MSNVLSLPQLNFLFSYNLPERQVLLVAGGRPPASSWLAAAAGSFTVWGVDSGVDSLKNSDVQPVAVIGDGDSATPAAWEWAKSLGIPVEIHPPEKDLTDLQLALQRTGELYEQAAVIVTGVWGGRFDHTFSNIYSLLGSKTFGLAPCCAADDKEILVLLHGPDRVNIQLKHQPSAVSLLPLSDCSGVTITGVRWPLNKVTLSTGLPYAISNRPTTDKTRLSVSLDHGCLGIYLCWDDNELSNL
ncbi:MAG: thiamine pyrophosphokinase [Firmicutes bacterium]|nr:thiamine pyrophosphokinase [Bacillota bacterium]